MDLTAVEDVRRLKYRYFRTLDLKEWEPRTSPTIPRST